MIHECPVPHEHRMSQARARHATQPPQNVNVRTEMIGWGQTLFPQTNGEPNKSNVYGFTTKVFDEIVARSNKKTASDEIRATAGLLLTQLRLYSKSASTNQVLQTAHRFEFHARRFQHVEGYALHVNQVKFKVFSFSGYTCAYYR